MSGVKQHEPVTVEVTVFTKVDGPLTKRIALGPDGRPVSDGSGCLMAHGRAERVRFGSLSEFAEVIGQLQSNQAIGLGALRDGLAKCVDVVTARELTKLNGTAMPNLVARTSDAIVYVPGSPVLILLDFDRKGMPGHVAAKIDPVDRDYFKAEIEPLLAQPHVEFIGEIGEHEKAEFLGNAAGLLFPIAWQEPFGLVMIEAMACGTPVIAFPFGSVPEVIEDGVNGFLPRDVKGGVKAVEKLDTIDRAQCRQRFEERFGLHRMTQQYLAIYDRILRGGNHELLPTDGDLGWTKLASASSTT